VHFRYLVVAVVTTFEIVRGVKSSSERNFNHDDTPAQKESSP
jgi:hypothetical protein